MTKLPIRIIAIATGIMAMAVGVLCFANAGMLFMNIAFPVGIALLITGTVGLLAYMFGIGETKREASWFLSESILVLFLSLIVLANLITNDLAVPYVFGMLLITSGILRLVLSLQNRLAMDRFEYVSNTVMGLVGLALGIYFFFNSIGLNLPVAVLAGIAVTVHGINILFFGIAMPAREKLRELYEEDEDDEF